MLAILLEHDNLRSARRAVLASSFLTLALPQIHVGGEGLKILGLVFTISEANLFQSAWLVTTYFFIIFLGFVAARIVSASKSRLQAYYGLQVMVSKQKAEELDDDNNFIDAPDSDVEFLDPWWQSHLDLESSMKRKTSIAGSISQGLLSALSAFVEFGAALMISACAVFFPERISSWLFSVVI